MNPKILFVFALLLNLVSNSFQNPNPKTPKSTSSQAHVELINHGLPAGKLGGACKITLPPDNYVATYSDTITGKIVKGKIAELEGIRVRAFFKWWSITGIRSSGDDIVFEVGMVTAKYPSKNFDDSPACEGQHSSS
ncbi:hypothetical protein glysoja_019021 [Glycine soja]|nr:hypothetical protein glysoja_019021 [Glycine soja]